MTLLIDEQVRFSWTQIQRLMDQRGILRKHLQVPTRVARSRYERLMKAAYGPDDFETWRDDVWGMLDEINKLALAPPREAKIAPATPVSWGVLFQEQPGFPPPPDLDARLPEMDGGASAIGTSWDRGGVEGYLQELQGERVRWQGLGDESKLRQVTEKLVSLYEALEDWEAAISHLYELRTINHRFKDAVFVADCNLRLGIALYRLQRWSEAGGVIQRGLAEVRQKPALLRNSKTELRLRGYEGLVALRRNDREAALKIFNEQVEPLVRLHDSLYVTATFHHRRAIIQNALHRFREAHSDIGRALELRIDCAAEVEATRSLYYLGWFCEAEGRPRAAIPVWQVCEHRQLRFKDALGLARSKLKLGDAYLELAQARGGPSDIIECSVYDADLNESELAAIAHMARGAHPDPDDGLPTRLRRGELSKLALSKLRECRAWAVKANNDSLVTASEASLERLRRARPNRRND